MVTVVLTILALVFIAATSNDWSHVNAKSSHAQQSKDATTLVRAQFSTP